MKYGSLTPVEYYRRKDDNLLNKRRQTLIVNLTYPEKH